MSDVADVVPAVPRPTQLELHRALSSDQVRAVQEFVQQVGGVDKARQALAALVKLKEAA